ncbi:MAG: STIMATE family protein [archaeon]|nr:STIMATE family protein [archaeon]
MNEIFSFYSQIFITTLRMLDGEIPNDPEPKCELFNFFSYVVQCVLALLSFSVLVFKRFRETPMRPWKVWFFDASKQVCSAGTQHGLNLLLSIMASVETTADECKWYFINFFLDTTIGVLICYGMMSCVQYFVKKHKIDILVTGFYFERTMVKGKLKYRLKIKMYLAQLVNWIIIIILNKFIMFGLNKLCKVPFEAVGNLVLKPFTFDDRVELVMVMIVFPVIFNIIQFWVFDEILKFSPAGDQSNDLIIHAMKDENEADFMERISENLDGKNDETRISSIKPGLNISSCTSSGTSTPEEASSNIKEIKEENEEEKLDVEKKNEKEEPLITQERNEEIYLKEEENLEVKEENKKEDLKEEIKVDSEEKKENEGLIEETA